MTDGRYYPELWAELFKRFGLSPSDPKALVKLTTYLALALAQARHPTRDEPAMPALAGALKRADDHGKTKAYENWRRCIAIEKEIAAAKELKEECSIIEACRRAHRRSENADIMGDVKNPTVLSKLYSRIKREENAAKATAKPDPIFGEAYGRKLPGLILSAAENQATFNHICNALAGLTAPRVPESRSDLTTSRKSKRGSGR